MRETRETRAVSRSKRGRGRSRARPKRAQTVDLERYREIVSDWADFTAAAERPEPTVLRVRTGRITPDALMDRLAGHDFVLRPKEGLPHLFEVESGPGPVSRTLEHWRYLGEGPCFRKLGGAVRYVPSDLETWLDRQSRQSTSDAGPEHRPAA